MAIRDLVFRVSGTVAYANGSHGPFDVSYNSASKGLVGGINSNPFASASAINFRNMDTSLPAVVTDTLALLPSSVTLSPDASADPKTATIATLFITGLIARDDNTSASFAIEYLDGAVNHFPAATDTVWAEIAGDSDASGAITTLMDLLVGSGNTAL